MSLKQNFELKMLELDKDKMNRVKEVSVYLFFKKILGESIFNTEHGARAMLLWAQTLTPAEADLGEDMKADVIAFIRNTLFIERHPQKDEEIIAMANLGMSFRSLMSNFKSSYTTISGALIGGQIKPALLANWDDEGRNLFVDLAYKHITDLLATGFIKI